MNTPDSDFKAGEALTTIVLAVLILFGLNSVVPSRHILVAGTLALPGATLMVVVLRDKPMTSILAPGSITHGLLAWTILGTVGLLMLIRGMIPVLLDSLPQYAPVLEGAEGGAVEVPPAIASFLVILLAPICEEVFFRGAVLRGIRTSWGTAAALVLSSSLFAAWHVVPLQMLVTFVLGVWFGWLAVNSGGLIAPFVAHALNNALVYALAVWGVGRLPAWFIIPAGLMAGVAAWQVRRMPVPEAVKL